MFCDIPQCSGKGDITANYLPSVVPQKSGRSMRRSTEDQQGPAAPVQLRANYSRGKNNQVDPLRQLCIFKFSALLINMCWLVVNITIRLIKIESPGTT